MTDVFTLKWSFGGPQHVRSYTAWPNRAKGSFSQLFRSFDPKVRTGPTEPRQILHKYSLHQYTKTICQSQYPLPHVIPALCRDLMQLLLTSRNHGRSQLRRGGLSRHAIPWLGYENIQVCFRSLAFVISPPRGPSAGHQRPSRPFGLRSLTQTWERKIK